MTALGGPQDIFGNLAVCDSQSFSVSGAPYFLCTLTEAQQDLIDDVHTAVAAAQLVTTGRHRILRLQRNSLFPRAVHEYDEVVGMSLSGLFERRGICACTERG
ncbi:hypothetical protein ACFU6I_21705 [Streptomyces sp. NPDC057486]|uniref:hypothetical protein n=1 Tax=Streptomyces sp. NPDC057486 TaxID=3346145 RepID=UPI0036B61E31